MENISMQAMGTTVQFRVVPEPGHSEAFVTEALGAVKHKVIDLEGQLSRFDAHSDVSSMNRNPGKWTSVRPQTIDVLRLAKEAFEQTDGLFNPGLGKVMQSMGYHISFERLQDTSHPPEFYVEQTAVRHCPYEISKNGQQVRIEEGYEVDLGGIAKGWIVEQCAQFFRQRGFRHFVCNAGGDMVCEGHNGEKPWAIGIENPFQAGNYVLTLDVDSLSLATSATHRRRWRHDGESVHHIIDPRSGTSSNSDIVSCSVLHVSLTAAEVMAKVCLILGSADGIPWLSKFPHRGWVIVKQSGEVVHSWNL